MYSITSGVPVIPVDFVENVDSFECAVYAHDAFLEIPLMNKYFLMHGKTVDADGRLISNMLAEEENHSPQSDGRASLSAEVQSRVNLHETVSET
jgi:hypothetical protein